MRLFISLLLLSMEAARRRGALHLPALGVEHPPGALSRRLVVDPQELVVEGQVVSDGVLAGRTRFTGLLQLSVIQPL